MSAFMPFPMVVVPEEAVCLALFRNPTWALVSIRAPGEPLDVMTSGPRLNLFFHDYDHVPQGLWSNQFTIPDRVHARQIVRFARELAASPPDGLICHCAAGISRSTATMLGVAFVLLGDPQAAVDLLLMAVKYAKAYKYRQHSDVWPNDLLVLHLDDELGCRGTLRAAVQQAEAQKRIRVTT